MRNTQNFFNPIFELFRYSSFMWQTTNQFLTNKFHSLIIIAIRKSHFMIRQKKNFIVPNFLEKNALLLLKMIDVVWLSVISQEYFFSLSICK